MKEWIQTVTACKPEELREKLAALPAPLQPEPVLSLCLVAILHPAAVPSMPSQHRHNQQPIKKAQICTMTFLLLQRRTQSRIATLKLLRKPLVLLHCPFEAIFNRAHHDFYNYNKIAKDVQEVIASQQIDMEDFDRITLHKQYQRYISLIDGRIVFHEVPNAPHGQVLQKSVGDQLDRTVFTGACDNGMTLKFPFRVDDANVQISSLRIGAK